ncbi:MAG: hypothetical protein VX341_10330 [Bdellovibrionota bacterium]|nr:hypothetical protein [Bdellovibrionota bacterium]
MLNFLIRIKGDDTEFLSLIPLIHGILNKHEDNRVSVIVDEGYEVNDRWFYDRLNIFQIPDKKRDSLFGAHQFAANLHDVFNVDYYIDFVSDFNSAFLGLAFRAKRKIGLQGGPKSYLYSYSLESFDGIFPDQKKLCVVKYIDELAEKDFSYIKSKEVKKVIEKVLFDFTSFKDKALVKKLEDIKNSFSDLASFGYVPSEYEPQYENLLKDPGTFEIFHHPEKEFVNLLERFDLFITDSALRAQVALLNGIRPFLILKEDEKLPVFSQMNSSVGQLRYDEDDLVIYGINEERGLKVLAELEDYIINYNTLRVEPTT